MTMTGLKMNGAGGLMPRNLQKILYSAKLSLNLTAKLSLNLTANVKLDLT
jgi:hypothetical protein